MPPTVTGTVLDGIISGVLEDLHERQLMVTSDNLREATELVAPAIDPIPRLTAPGLSVISEIKRSSPSNGQLAAIHDPAALADQYRSGGAAAISVLTEERRFQGSLADLDAVRAKVEIPVLRKDFVVAEYQVLEARAHGADLILLIVAALSDDDLQRLYDLAIELGMTPLVEVHTPEEVSRATALGARVVGVNARNLKTLDVDKTIFGELLDELTRGFRIVLDDENAAVSSGHLLELSGFSNSTEPPRRSPPDYPIPGLDGTPGDGRDNGAVGWAITNSPRTH